MNWAELLDNRMAGEPAGPCIADATTALSNAQFAQRVHAVAAQLGDYGVRPGSVLAVQLHNRVELVIALFAAWRRGAAVTPVNPQLTDAETAHQIGDAGATLVIADDRRPPAFDGRYLDVADLATVAEATDAGTQHQARPDEVALLIYTSGSTGAPKGVMLTHANLQAMCTSFAAAFEITAADHCLLILPLFHANAILVSTLTPLLAGAQTTIAGRFTVDTFFEAVQRHRPTYFSGVPTIFTRLDAVDPAITPDMSSLRFAVVGAAPMSAELIGRIENRYGFPLIEGYGLSEGTCASTLNPLRGPRKPGTVGLPLPGQQVRIVGSDGAVLPAGQPGEVAISGPTVMAGYLGKPAETAETVIDGWLHTGDVGYLDEDGYLVLVDRIKDMIIRGGENLYPKEIEAALYQHPEVAEAAVIGAPDPNYGEVPVGYVSLRPGATATAEELLEVCRKTLSKFKIPVDITVVEALPKNPIGKIDKPALRAERASAHSAQA